MKSLAWCVTLLAVIAISLTIGPHVSRAEEGMQVALIVIFPDRTETFCVTVTESPARGIDALRAAGLRLVTQTNPGLGSAVCKIEGIGCDYPGEDCFCACVGQPCNYWNYWYQSDGEWLHSPLGASSREIADGAVECWLWGAETQRPPEVHFGDICIDQEPVPVTETPTITPEPSATVTPVLTDTPQPTQTALPTDTPLVTATVSPQPTATSTITPAQSPSVTQVWTPTATSTRTSTPAQPTATRTPWSPYPDGSPTVTRTRTRTPTVTRTATPSRTSAVTPTPWWTLTPSPIISLTPPAPTRVGQEGAYPVAEATASSIPSPMAIEAPTMTPQLLIAAAPTGTGNVGYPVPAMGSADLPVPTPATAWAVASVDDSGSGDEGQILQSPSRSGSQQLDDAQIARLVNTAVARSSAPKAPGVSSEKRREEPRAYGAFAAILGVMLLGSIYIIVVRRQRAFRRASDEASSDGFADE